MQPLSRAKQLPYWPVGRVDQCPKATRLNLIADCLNSNQGIAESFFCRCGAPLALRSSLRSGFR